MCDVALQQIAHVKEEHFWVPRHTQSIPVFMRIPAENWTVEYSLNRPLDVSVHHCVSIMIIVARVYKEA